MQTSETPLFSELLGQFALRDRPADPPAEDEPQPEPADPANE